MRASVNVLCDVLGKLPQELSEFVWFDLTLPQFKTVVERYPHHSILSVSYQTEIYGNPNF